MAEWKEKSAPSCSGRVVGGGAQVEFDSKDSAGGVRRLGSAGDIDHVPGGVHRRFDPDERRLAGRDGAREGIGFRRIEEIKADAALSLLAQHPALDAVIHDIGRGDALTGIESLDQGCNRRHAGSEGK